MLLIFAVVWCLTHLGTFVALRHAPVVASERGILLFHLASFAALLGLTAILVLTDAAAPAIAVGALSIHGIYSLSFLELWSLSEGGFSMLALLKLSRGPMSRPALLAELAAIGLRKKRDRLRALASGGLIAGDSVVGPTLRGRLAAAAVRLLRWIANLKDAG